MKLAFKFLAPFLFCRIVSATLAQEQQFTNYHCAITPPLGWHLVTVPPQPGLLVTYGSLDRKGVLMLIVNDRDKVGPINDRFIDEYERGIQNGTKGKDHRVSGKFIQIAGLKAYERLGQSTINGRPVSTISQNLPANGIFYTVQGMRFEGNADTDSEIRQGLESFRFLTPPVAPQATMRGSAAYRVGYLVGSFGALLLIVGGAATLIIVVVTRARKRGSKPPPVPPGAR